MSGIYLRRGDELVAMRETPYDTEAVLQELVAKHPEMLAGEDSEPDTGSHHSWLLVRREAPVFDEGDLASRGSLDHLFLDQFGLPTLVEVKRSNDTRIRREVVGQMLDYAANAAHWSVERLQRWLGERCVAEGTTADDALSTHTNDVDAFWEDARTNLAAGRMRLVFVADEIPPALRRVVEFLNGQMTECEVLAIEVKQYVDESGGHQTIVPRVIGQTEVARTAKGQAEGRVRDKDTILTVLAEKRGRQQAALAERLFDWASQPDLRWYFGRGKVDGSFQAGLEDATHYFFPFVLYTYGRIEVGFQWMARRPPFDDDTLRDDLRRRLNEIPGVDLGPDTLNRRPAIDLAVLVTGDSFDRFLAIADWTLDQARAS